MSEMLWTPESAELLDGDKILRSRSSTTEMFCRNNNAIGL